MQVAEVPINLINDFSRCGIWKSVALQEAGQIGKPHSRREPLSGDVAKRREHLTAVLRQDCEISRKIPCREDFAGEFHASALHRARTTQLALDLRRFEQLRVQIEALAYERVHFLQQRDIDSDGCGIRCLRNVPIAKASTFTRCDSTPRHANLHFHAALSLAVFSDSLVPSSRQTDTPSHAPSKSTAAGRDWVPTSVANAQGVYLQFE